MNNPYHIVPPQGSKVPILVSVPHCAVNFPEELRDHYRPELAANPDDTDFFVHQVYNFVTEMGITMIYAKYSRWVIDLNRTPDNVSLYDDGRIITALTPVTDFMGRKIYVHTDLEPDQKEIERRKHFYFQPYYNKIEGILKDFKAEFGQALLWDAHSIRRFVPTIRNEPFPDLILGDNEEQSASKTLIDAAQRGLTKGLYNLSHNFPFKGGNITRHFGRPENGIHALQLEMCKNLYMDDTETKYEHKRANALRKVLRPVFELLIKALLDLRFKT